MRSTNDIKVSNEILGSMMIKTKDVDLNASIDGDGNPVIFVHGYTTTSNFWWHQIPDLAKFYKTVRFDLRGHGDSGKPENISYNIESFGTDLLNVMDSLGIEKAVIFGLSMGGAVVMDFAYKHPDRVVGLGLISTTAHGLGPMVQAKNVLNKINEVGVEKASQDVIVHSFSAKTDPVIIEWAKKEVIKSPTYVAKEAIKSLDAFDIRDKLCDFNFPTLIAVGEEDEITPVENSKLMHESIPNSELHVIPGAAHFPMLEKSFTFNQIALSFLKKIKM